MGLEKIIFILACVSGAFTFTCPEDTHSFYHADVSTGCTVYHFCENSQLTTMTCPSGEAFNHVTSNCEDASTVSCIETMDHHNMHHHHKRSIEEYHSIDIRQLKTRVVDLYHEVKPLVISAVKDTAPSVYAKFEADYLPSIRKFQKDVMPYIYEKVFPGVEKSVSYVRRMGARVFKKAYESYELSNSTHIAIASFSDIVDDVSKDIKPYIEVGRYMTARMFPRSRGKRSAIESIPDALFSFAEPIIKNMFRSVGATFTGDSNTLPSKVILPIVYNMMEDPETRFDLLKVFYSAKAAFTPVIWEMLSRQTYNTPEGTIIKIPRAVFDSAVNKFFTDTKPIINKILSKHLSMILFKASQNVPVIMQSVDSLVKAKKFHSGVLHDSILNFITKHGALMKSSNSQYVNTYTLSEIKQDLKPIFVTLLQVFSDYYSGGHNSWGNLFSNQNTRKSTVFAKPSPIHPRTRTAYRG